MIRTVVAAGVIALLARAAAYGDVPSPPVAPGKPPAPSSDNGAGDLVTTLELVSLNLQVTKLYGEGKFQEAVPVAEHCLALIEQVLGPTDPLVARSLSNLANLYIKLGFYSKAEPLLLRARDLRENGLPPDDPEVAESLNILGALYWEQGRYSEAEPLLTRALEIREKALGPRHRDVAQALNNLATLYKTRAAYDKAEPLLARASDIYDQLPGAPTAERATIVNNLATVYQDQGAYDKAEPLYVRALHMRETELGRTHPDVAIALNNLASLYRDRGTYDKAQQSYIRACDIYEKSVGPIHPYTARCLNNLAHIQQLRGMYSEAESLYVRALQIREQVLPAMHPDFAENLNNLALLHRMQGRFDEAESLFIRALDIADQALGAHPLVAVILNNLADLHRARGAPERAIPLLARAAEIREQQLREEIPPLPEPRKRAVMLLLQGETDSLVSLHAALPTNRQALELAFTAILRRKGRILDSVVDNQIALRDHLTPRLRDQLDRLNQARRTLAERLYTPREQQAASDPAAIAALRSTIDDLESALSADSAQFRAIAQPVTLTRIQQALPPGAALVELVRYRDYDPRRSPAWQDQRYAAYLLTPQGPPRWVPLGPAAPIDRQVSAVVSAMNRRVPLDTARAALRRLDAALLSPLRAELTGVSHLIVAPDSQLNLVPFEALIDPSGHYALEDYVVSYLATGRDVLQLAASQPARSPPAIVAAPDYGPPASPGTPGRRSLAPLPGALAEADDLRPYFHEVSLIGDRATKPALAALVGPAMLHIATHGFYTGEAGPRVLAPSASPVTRSAPRSARRRADPRLLSASDPARDMFITGAAPPPTPLDDPADALDRAGLALAGANQDPAGIVTAREIAGFDWWGTQLIVLSACETGVGAVPSGDGVYGLRRAVVLAGAASQVVSLWSVSDASTRALMRDYYGELARGTGRAEALRQAKLRLMRGPRYAHPFYWAAFVPTGDWRALDRNTIRDPGRGP